MIHASAAAAFATPARLCVLMLVMLPLGRGAALGAPGDADRFASCRARFADAPDDYESAYCFYQVTLDAKAWDEGQAVFEALIAAHPDNFWLPMAYGHVFRARDPERAEALYRRAADGFAQRQHAEGELLARSNLRNFLFPKGRAEDAARETARVVALGEASRDPLLKARAWTLEATQVQDSGGDLGRAYRLLKQVEGAIFPDGPARLQRTCLNSLGLVAFRMGRLDEALNVFTRMDALAVAEGDTLARANAQYHLLNTLALKQSVLPTPGSRRELLARARQSLTIAESAGNREVTLKSLRTIAEMLAADAREVSDAAARAPLRDEALAHAERCVTVAAAWPQPHDEAVCAWVQAALYQTADAAKSRAARSRALAATDRARSPRTQAYSASRHMRLTWDADERPAATRNALAALDAIEALRRLQEDEDSSAELFSTWTGDYYWLSGRLLEEDGRDLPHAFAIGERMRARALLEALDRRASPDVAPRRGGGDRDGAQAVATVQRQLMNPDLSAPARSAALAELDRLERVARDARRRTPGGALAEAATAFATLDELQASLAEDQAMLVYQIGLWQTFDGEFGGGSWVTVLTRDRRAVHRLPDRVQLAAAVPMFGGLLERRDALEASVGATLHREVIGAALQALPPTVSRLVIVPDGPLHDLPFDALRASADAAPLGARYEVTVTPSATLWLRWRQRPPRSLARGTLVIADPTLDLGAAASSARSASLQQGLRLGQLPQARREGRAIARHLDGVESFIGDQATEHTLKGLDLGRYDILHFAAHAVADGARPERSAVVLAPGTDDEDGLLQPREIEQMDLRGRIIVLSACQTAAGAVLSGEGVLSLARAFFRAGASAVVGTRWTIRDADAAALFETFYAELAEGASLAEALRASRRQAIDAQLPASRWAGLILLGNGDLRPIPKGSTNRRTRAATPVVLGGGLIAGLALVGVLAWRRRRIPATR